MLRSGSSHGCLYTTTTKGALGIRSTCAGSEDAELWQFEYDPKQHLVNKKAMLCLSVGEEEGNGETPPVKVAACDGRPEQNWLFVVPRR